MRKREEINDALERGYPAPAITIEALLDIRDLLEILVKQSHKPVIAGRAANAYSSREDFARAICPHEWVEDYETKNSKCEKCGVEKTKFDMLYKAPKP